MANYSDYYQRPIDSGDKGIKLVLGPTGLGKSSSIPDVVKNNPDRKFIYQANRKELLQEMAARFSPGEFVILRRDLEVVQKMLAEQQLEFDQLLAEPRFANQLKQAKNKFQLKSLEVAAIRRACKQVAEITAREGILPEWLEKHADSQARIILQAVRQVIQITRDKNGKSAIYNWLISHPVVETLFPAIPFRHRPECRIMLLTLHKAYYGFFDGVQVRSLTSLFEENNAILFLDEFDFLENDLVKLICRVPQVSDPFDFVAHFYRAMAHHKLPKQDFPLHPKLRDRIINIVKFIETIPQRGLNYPNINQFTLVKTHKPGITPAIFRTNRTISTNPLYINQTTRSFQLEMKKSNQAWIDANWFFNVIGLATTLIIALFKDLEHDNERTYWELMRQCFRNTDFFDQVITIPRLPRQQQSRSTQRSSLLHGGYNLFDINDLQQRTDNEEVEVFFYQMLQTPENLLRTLGSKHLIFGLSATADLRRSIHHFDLDWLENEGLLLPTTDEDRNDIQQLSDHKAKLRQELMTVTQINGLETSNPLQKRISDFLHAVVHNDEFDEDSGGHRSQRMHRFFAAFLWLLEQGGDRPRQLLFLNSFLQVQLLFTTFASHAKEAGIYTIERLPDTPWFHAFKISIESYQATVVFFNAELATQVRKSKNAEQAFTELFWTPDPVVVVTQYLSAGNGVNLQYTNEEGGKEQDFTHIGLLETPYYFFTKPDIEQDFNDIFAGHKENIWYQAKLFFSKLISEERFRKILETTNKPFAWNADYQKGTTARDNLLNCLVIFMQALGRVERTWQKLSSPQVALLHADVFRIFQAFLHDEFETIRNEHDPFSSANLKSVLKGVAVQTINFERLARRKHDGRLYAHNEQCRDAIHALVRRLETVRSQGQDQAARRDWEDLRYAVLRHDFHTDIATRYHCTTSSPYYAKGQLNIRFPELDILPQNVILPEAKIIKIDAMYSIISGNTIIQEHFSHQGFDLKFDHPGTYFFTPYCLQAILAGAIGEEAIAALLSEHGILVEALPDPLFEVVDQRITGKPWFIDCKNYNDHTLDRFSLPIGDPLRHPTLNDDHFVQHAKTKIQRIIQYAGQESKLLYINLVSGQERPLGYYNRDFQPVPTFDLAEIIVVQGALDRQAPNFFQAAFTTLLADLRKALKLVEENDLT